MSITLSESELTELEVLLEMSHRELPRSVEVSELLDKIREARRRAQGFKEVGQ
jgi:hypothetical protein